MEGGEKENRRAKQAELSLHGGAGGGGGGREGDGAIALSLYHDLTGQIADC